MNRAHPLSFVEFASQENPLVRHIHDRGANADSALNAKYIRRYLETLKATTVIVEHNYFDRDYLEEYASFYSRSSRGYQNICSRLHFFSGNTVDRELLLLAFSDDDSALEALNDNYLGFIVMRPIPEARLGRTVLKWFDDRERNSFPRIIEPARLYRAHIANVTLEVYGLAWQEQDSAVAACATVGIWTLMHSSALTERHGIPTTSDITKAANKTDTLGKNTFPSKGLTLVQIGQAIKQLGFSPSSVNGDLPSGYFSKPRFASVAAAFLRSGYPLLVIGSYKGSNSGHAICAVGFRDSKAPDDMTPEKVYRQDAYINTIYAHDDNYGPNLRMQLEIEVIRSASTNSNESVCKLVMKAPDYLEPNENGDNVDKQEFIPYTVMAAVQNDLRTCPADFMQFGDEFANFVNTKFNQTLTASNQSTIPLIYSTRFVQLTDYLSKELFAPLQEKLNVLGQVRMRLIEELPPMSLHLAILRIATDNLVLLDLIYDTTDSDRNRPVFGHVVYDEKFLDFISLIKRQTSPGDFERLFGKQIIAF